MVPEETEPVSGRVPAEWADRLDRAADETGRTKSQIVKDAVERYIDQNPDDLQAFYPDDPYAAFVESLF